MKLVLLATLCVLAPVSTYAQAPPSQAKSLCTLSIAKAPAIRGVKVGMKVDEVLALFPGSAEHEHVKPALANAESFPRFGLFSFFVFPQEFSTRDRFAGITMIKFTFFDGHVREYEVQYDAPPTAPSWTRVDDWITKLADTFKLPPAPDWVAEPNLTTQKSLKCDGFQMKASTVNLRGQLSVSLLDSPLKTQKERQAAYEEKLRQEFKP